MKRLIGAVMSVALLVAVAPVLAGDSFQALSRLPAGLTPLDDAQLAAVEGGYGFDFCFDCTNVVRDSQLAVNDASSSLNFVFGDFEQEIDQEVKQSIN